MLKGPKLTISYNIAKDEIHRMEVLCCYCENFVIFVMNFMEFIQSCWLMEETMSPIEEEVLQKVYD